MRCSMPRWSCADRWSASPSSAVRCRWGCELLWVPPEPDQEYRHNDALMPLWGLFDTVPEGRGDFSPELNY